MAGHEATAGADCVDDGGGACVGCGVAMVECSDCGGIGYHRPSCGDLGITDGLSVLADCADDAGTMSQSDRVAIAVHGLVNEIGLVAVLEAIRNGADACCDVEEDAATIERLQEFKRYIRDAISQVQS